MSNKLHCEDCRWWTLITEQGATINDTARGRCRGRAPIGTAVVMPVVNKIANTVTPQLIEVTVRSVTGANWEACGDFKAIVELAEAKLKMGAG